MKKKYFKTNKEKEHYSSSVLTDEKGKETCVFGNLKITIDSKKTNTDELSHNLLDKTIHDTFNIKNDYNYFINNDTSHTEKNTLITSKKNNKKEKISIDTIHTNKENIKNTTTHTIINNDTEDDDYILSMNQLNTSIKLKSSILSTIQPSSLYICCDINSISDYTTLTNTNANTNDNNDNKNDKDMSVLYCWWCRVCSFKKNECICFLPLLYDTKRQRYKTAGFFCSWSCVKAYNFSLNDIKLNYRKMLINQLCRQLYGIVRAKRIKVSPHWSMCCLFGGQLELTRYIELVRSANSDLPDK
jgi:hypothetical protein